LFSLSINGRALITVGIRNKIALCKQAFERAPLLLKCLMKTLYVWDGFITISLNHLFMLMIRFYDGMFMLTNNAINILNDLMWILSYWCIDMLEHIYFICLSTYSSWILTGYVCLLFYPPLLEDFNSILLYSWGSDVLSCLYRHLS
jgi:hypothetical protein